MVEMKESESIRSRSGLDDGYGLGLIEPGRVSADRLVRRVVGERVPQGRSGRPRRRLVRLNGHRYSSDGQHVLLAVRTDERADRAAAAVDDHAVRQTTAAAAVAGPDNVRIALVRAARPGRSGEGRAAAVHVAPFLQHGVEVAGRVRPALAAKRVAPSAGRRAAAGVRSGRQVNACQTHAEPS